MAELNHTTVLFNTLFCDYHKLHQGLPKVLRKQVLEHDFLTDQMKSGIYSVEITANLYLCRWSISYFLATVPEAVSSIWNDLCNLLSVFHSNSLRQG